MDLQLAKRVVLVTGSTRGLGRVTARRLAVEGADLVICGRGADDVDATRREVEANGARVEAVVADVTKSGAAEALVEAAVGRFGRLDAVVANAGGAVGESRLDDTSDADWEATYRWNVVHSVGLIRAARRYLAQSDAPSVVLIGSVSAGLPSPWPQYAAAKAALEAVTRSLASEMAADGIRVNCVRPGSMLFDGGAWQRYADAEPDAFRAFVNTDFPAGRLGTPEEVADVVAFVLSPRARWINGAVIPVDGGQRRSSPYPRESTH
jgi:3-oxoacyl-[acyl-carrier protein] reductase